ncbi:Cytochrome c oxidase subunit IV [Mycobacteroides abscessus subsp. abscessus]|nr:Cytochrome c oxidase subunit IV [Mycobacteroides abscessus subsp. abscessus]
MRITGLLFGGLTVFLVPVAIVYGFMTGFEEWVGFPALLLTAIMCGFLAFFIFFTEKHHPDQPSDNLDGEIVDAAGDYGFYSPWSWWPLMLGIVCAIAVVGMAVGWWILAIAAPLAVVGLVGWVYEYNRGAHAH